MSYFNTGIKSIQRGTITFAQSGPISVAATISAVDVTKTELRMLGFTAGSIAEGTCRIFLTNATTVTATCTSTATGTTVVSWELTEHRR